MPKFTGLELQRARDYVREEPGFTAPFMAWELGLPLETTKALTARLLEDGVVYVVEPPQRPFAAVYAYKVPQHVLDAQGAPRLYVEDHSPPPADLAAQRGQVVAHTRARGESDTPGRNRKRQRQGQRIKKRGDSTAG